MKSLEKLLQWYIYLVPNFMTVTLLLKTFEIELNCVELTPLNRDRPQKAQPLNGQYPKSFFTFLFEESL